MPDAVISPTPPPAPPVEPPPSDPVDPTKKKPKAGRPAPEPKPFRVKHDLVGPFAKGELVSGLDLFGPDPKLDVDAALNRLFDLDAIEEA